LLGEAAFESIHFLHHPLLRNERGEKLSKSAGDGIRGNYSP
jgi:glutamyl/glutaminyl-tRNA synthetase